MKFEEVTFQDGIYFFDSPRLKEVYFSNCKGSITLRNLKLERLTLHGEEDLKAYKLENTTVDDIIFEEQEVLDVFPEDTVENEIQKSQQMEQFELLVNQMKEAMIQQVQLSKEHCKAAFVQNGETIDQLIDVLQSMKQI